MAGAPFGVLLLLGLLGMDRGGDGRQLVTHRYRHRETGKAKTETKMKTETQYLVPRHSIIGLGDRYG